MPGVDGLSALARMREIRADACVVVMTAHGTMETAIQAMQRGAYDYLTKPFDLDEVLLLAERALAGRPAHAGGGPAQDRAAGGAGVQRADRPPPAHAGRLQDDRPHRRQRRHGAPARRVGHRQGAGGARHPPLQPARRPPVRGGVLRGHSRHAARVRAVRARARRLHRRQGAPARQVRAGPRRHALPRRDRRHAARAAEQAAARAAGADDRAAGRPRVDPDRRAGARRDQPRPRGPDARGAVPRGPLLPAQRGHPEPAAAARAPARHPAAGRALPGEVRRRPRASAASRPTRSTAWSATTGRATCASWRTWSSARW